MKQITFYLLLSTTALNACSVYPDKPGKVIFNLGQSPGSNEFKQKVAMYGCNNTVKRIDNLKWNTSNQVYDDIPHGWNPYNTNSNSNPANNYFISKYYLTSPPVNSSTPPKPFKKVVPGNKYTLGLLFPEKFVFQNRNPVQSITLDYTILKPVYLRLIDVDYDKSFDGACLAQKYKAIPIRTICPKLPRVDGHTGASGIGTMQINQSDSDITLNKSQIFLPTKDQPGHNPYKCTATILNDITYGYDIQFVEKGIHKTTIQLNEIYKGCGSVGLTCKTKTKRPTGCSMP